MKIFRHDKIDKGTAKKYRFCGITLLKSYQNPDAKRYYMLGLKVWSSKNILNQKELIKQITKSRENILWIDHRLGGGADQYSQSQFNDLQKKVNILRLQYCPLNKYFILQQPFAPKQCILTEISEVYNLLEQISWDKIVINNLVGYTNPIEILSWVEKIKNKNDKLLISFRCHDYYAVCPRFNLLDCDGKFCNLNYSKGCDECLKFLYSPNEDNRLVPKQDLSIKSWRNNWQHFFENVCDEVIAFSASTANIFSSVFSVKDIIKVIPHKSADLPMVQIPKHKQINIVFLGNLSNYSKGRDVLIEMSKCVKNYKDVKLHVIGKMTKGYKNIKVMGKYKVSELPKIIQQIKTDIVFISSICPETFSYTTAEAMSMGLPVVCYNLGAPAERIQNYKKGLVLNEINPEENLKEIINFVTDLKNK